MTEQTSFVNEGMDRVTSVFRSLDGELRRVQKQLQTRRKSFEKQLSSGRRDIERQTRKQVKRLQTELAQEPADQARPEPARRGDRADRQRRRARARSAPDRDQERSRSHRPQADGADAQAQGARPRRPAQQRQRRGRFALIFRLLRGIRDGPAANAAGPSCFARLSARPNSACGGCLGGFLRRRLPPPRRPALRRGEARAPERARVRLEGVPAAHPGARPPGRLLPDGARPQARRARPVRREPPRLRLRGHEQRRLRPGHAGARARRFRPALVRLGAGRPRDVSDPHLRLARAEGALAAGARGRPRDRLLRPHRAGLRQPRRRHADQGRAARLALDPERHEALDHQRLDRRRRADLGAHARTASAASSSRRAAAASRPAT